MIILGVAYAFEHDPGAAILVDGEIVAAVEEERFTRHKHAVDEAPVHSIRYCLEAAGVRPDQVDLVAFPWSGEAYSRSRWAYVRRVWRSKPSYAFKAIAKRKTRLQRARRRLRRVLDDVGISESSCEIVQVEHHLAHASSAYHLSGFDGAAVLTIDGKGEFASTWVGEGVGAELRCIAEILEPDSLGLFYSTLTDYLGFLPHDGEFKVMGMSPYGDAQRVDLSPFLSIGPSGFRVDENAIWVRRGRRYRGRRYSQALVDRLGPPREGLDLAEPYTHVAAATQKGLEDAVGALLECHLAGPLERNRGRLCLAGGCALNVRLNRKLLEHPLVREIFVQPAAHDAGTSLGAATYVASRRGVKLPPMRGAFLGPETDDGEAAAILERFHLPFERLDEDGLVARAADLLASGEVIAWFQGRMEFGPRALGHRSILGHPAVPGTARQINERIKYRETWRPFCPSVLASDAPEILGTDHPAPCMNLSFTVSEDWRSRIPEVVHVDHSARAQTVEPDLQPRFHRLISAFKERTGLPVLLNTSLNRKGEPVACTVEDALATFFGSGLEHLFIGTNYVCKRSLAPTRPS